MADPKPRRHGRGWGLLLVELRKGLRRGGINHHHMARHGTARCGHYERGRKKRTKRKSRIPKWKRFHGRGWDAIQNTIDNRKKRKKKKETQPSQGRVLSTAPQMQQKKNKTFITAWWYFLSCAQAESFRGCCKWCRTAPRHSASSRVRKSSSAHRHRPTCQAPWHLGRPLRRCPP